jgi:hypothetical protein
MTENGFKERLGLSQQEIAQFEKYLTQAEKRALQGSSWGWFAFMAGDAIILLALSIISIWTAQKAGSIADSFEAMPWLASTTAPVTRDSVAFEVARAMFRMHAMTAHWVFQMSGLVLLVLAGTVLASAFKARARARRNLLFVKIARRLWEGNQGREIVSSGQK